MNTNLLTHDGFPRADIDVAQIRTTRARIIHLKNDYKDLMATIEKHIHEHFASLSEEANETPASQSDRNQPLTDSIPETLDPPFARVVTVADNSPAAQAGLKPEDRIRNFGYVNHTNHDGLKKVGECVLGNQGQNILVKVTRAFGTSQAQEMRLMLTPRSGWGGRGMLGCYIVPV